MEAFLQGKELLLNSLHKPETSNIEKDEKGGEGLT